MERLAETDTQAKHGFDHSLALSIINTLNSPDSDQLLGDARLVLSELQFHDGDEAQVFINLLTNDILTSARVQKAFELLAQMAQQQNLAAFEHDLRDKQSDQHTEPPAEQKSTPTRQVVQIGAVATAEVVDDDSYLFDVEPKPWQELAACGDKDPEIFFIDDLKTEKLAKAVCSTCDARVECLEYALKAGDDNGVWGGLTGDERRALRKRQLKNKKYS